MEDGLGNWQWLVQLERTSDALVILSGPEAPSWALTDGFDRTTHRTIDEDWRAFPEASLDCIAVPDAAALFQAPEGARATIAAMRDRLRSGGCYVGVECLHPSDNRRSLLSFIRAQRRSQHHLLTQSGFKDVRTYYVVQSPAAPRHLIPNHRTALAAWDAAVAPADRRSVIRRLLYQAGLAGMILRFRLSVARA